MDSSRQDTAQGCGLNPRQLAALRRIAGAHFEGLKKPHPLPVSRWAEQVRRLSIEASAERGRWVNRPFQAEPMDCLTPNSPYQQVVLMVASQTMKTELILNFLGYVIDRDPGPCLIVEPREIDGRALSKDRINPMLRDTPELAAKILKKHRPGMGMRGLEEERHRPGNMGSTALHIKFLGGHVSIAGSHSPAGLAMRPIRYLMLDEVDRYPTSAGQEGDPVLLAMRRTDEFAWNKKVLLCSTPTVEGWSRIQRAYEESDQRRPQVPCPLCGEFQELEFPRLKFGKDPKTAAYQCAHCNQLIPHWKKGWMLANGRWVITRPESAIAGFWLSQLYSIRRSWVDIAAEFVIAEKAPDTLRVFINTVLAQTWKEKSEAPDWRRLYDRAEPFPLKAVPKGGLLLTAGVDVQEDRLEIMVTAWGKGKENWLVDYVIIEGSVRHQGTTTLADGSKRPSVWQRLSELRDQTYPHAETGVRMPIQMMAIDCGWATQEVYTWARSMGPGRVMVTKGVDTATNRGVLVGAPVPVDISFGGKKVNRGTRYWPVNTFHAKDELYGWLRLDPPAAESGDPYPPNYCHFAQMNQEWFKELTAEVLETHIDRKGYRKQVWAKHGKNEVLDTKILARVAAFRMDVDKMSARDWRKWERSVMAPAAIVETTSLTSMEPQLPPKPAAPAADPDVPEPQQQVVQAATINRKARTRSSYQPKWQQW